MAQHARRRHKITDILVCDDNASSVQRKMNAILDSNGKISKSRFKISIPAPLAKAVVCAMQYACTFDNELMEFVQICIVRNSAPRKVQRSK